MYLYLLYVGDAFQIPAYRHQNGNFDANLYINMTNINAAKVLYFQIHSTVPCTTFFSHKPMARRHKKGHKSPALMKSSTMHTILNHIKCECRHKS